MKKIITTLIIIVIAIFAVSLFTGCAERGPVSPPYQSAEVAAQTNTQSVAQPALQSGASIAEPISEQTAKETALNHAQLTENDVTFVRVKFDMDDGRAEYEIEFYSGMTEYDYDIDAYTGAILSVDRDAEYYSPHESAPVQSMTEYISQADAEATALAHAGFSADEVSFLRTEFEIDDGRAEYEVEFYVGFTEYSYDINAVSGEIQHYEMDRD